MKSFRKLKALGTMPDYRTPSPKRNITRHRASHSSKHGESDTRLARPRMKVNPALLWLLQQQGEK